VKNVRVVAGLRDDDAIAEVDKGQVSRIGREVLGRGVAAVERRLLGSESLQRRLVAVRELVVAENLLGPQRHIGT
jgi:hypothetical protein